MKIIAEIGCNHKGDMDIAKKYIKTASEYCGVPIIKFQKRNNKELLSKEQYNSPHPVSQNSYGKTYGEHREFLEFDIEQHKELKEYCEKHDVIYSSSVWDITSAEEISSLNPDLIKIPSACNNNYDMIKWLCDNYGGEIHCSTGMTTEDEIEEIVYFFEKNKRNKDLILYSCTSGYPVEFKDVCLLEITRLKNKYENIIKEIGFSGHHLGIAIDNAALALGASCIERHFTLDRTWKGTDHAASLEPDGLRKLVRDLTATNDSLNFKDKDILNVEIPQRNKLKYIDRK